MSSRGPTIAQADRAVGRAAVVSRASRVAGVPHNRPLEVQELLRVCEALAVEGSLIQEVAEMIASEALLR